MTTNQECQICKNKDFSTIGKKDSYDIIKCSNCELYQLSPLPSLECRTEFYNGDSNFNYYQSRLNHKFKRAKNKIKSLQKFITSEDKSFLDIGCSIGAYVGAAANLGFKADGIDLSREAIKIAKKNFPESNFYAKSLDSLLADSDTKYDIIHCRDIIEHVTDLNEFMEPLSKLLKPNGILYISTPDAGHIRVPKSFTSWKHVHTPDHVFYFNKSNLTSLMEKYHISKIKIPLSTRTTIEYIGQKVY